jgi:hypothetical protein
MDDKKLEGTGEATPTTTGETVAAAEEIKTEVAEVAAAVSETAAVSTDSVAEVASEPGRAFNIKAYAGMVAAILIIAGGLLFVLEKEGRINTGLFSGLITKLEASKPAANVNGAVIPLSDFKSSLLQLNQMSAAQGMDVTDAALSDQLKTQAIDTLVNAELLRQAAVEAGMTVSEEEVEARFSEIRDGLGGAELLAAKMAEFGVTEASLRRDIENEFLIQDLFDSKFNREEIEVTDEEVYALYEQAGGEAAGLPPLADIREQIEAQIVIDKEQAQIGVFIEELRSAAEIEILI